MEPLQIVDVTDRDFGTKTQLDGAVITTQMRGNWDMTAATPLDEFTRNLQARAEQMKVERVIVELAEVEFMNSSCLKSFARWLASLSKKEQHGYTVTFRTGLPWQRRSLEALKALASDKITIEF